MAERTCSIEGCDERHNAKGLCRMHRKRQLRTGDVRPDVPPRIQNYNGQPCSECERPAERGGYCNRHYRRVRKYGDPSAENRWAGDAVGYLGAHKRVWRSRGAAADQTCVDCGAPAAEWSLIRGRGTHVGSHGDSHGLRYSIDPMDYEPRCKPCHVAYDKADKPVPAPVS